MAKQHTPIGNLGHYAHPKKGHQTKPVPSLSKPTAKMDQGKKSTHPGMR